MNAAARRSRRKRDWPRGLYEPRPGYYVWRHPDGRTLPIGRVDLDVAINEAIDANRHCAEQKPGLVERLTGSHNTIADVLDKMPQPTATETRRAYAVYDRLIREKLGKKTCGALTVTDCAELINEKVDAGRVHAAKYLRSRLKTVCTKAVALGWMESNVAEVTEEVSPKVKRRRLTLDDFWKIHERAPEVTEWLQHAMMLALVTGQDRSTVCAMERSHICDGALIVWRSKTRATNQPVAIPLELRMEAAGVSLAELVARKTPVISKHLLHHVQPWARAKPGNPVPPEKVSKAFAAARDLAGLGGENPPTFHEIRSLAKRLYKAQGNVDTKALLGHASDTAAAIYEDPRGIEPIRVRLGTQVNTK